MGSGTHRLVRAMALAVIFGGPFWLSACGAPAPQVPIPTSGGAWGSQVVPHDATITLTITRTDTAELVPIAPADSLDVTPGQVLTFEASLNTGPSSRPDFHLFLAGARSAITVEPQALTAAGHERDISPEELRTLGMPLGDLSGGTEVRMSFTATVPDDPSCDTLKPQITWGGYDGTGHRHWESFRLNVKAPACSSP